MTSLWPFGLTISRRWVGSFSEGLVVKFSPSNQEEWVDNFQRGLTGPDIVLEHPDQRHMIVIAGGVGYIIDPEAAKLTHQLSDLINTLSRSPDLTAVVLGDDAQFESFRADGLWWQCGPISWDGFRKIVKLGMITGQEANTAESMESRDNFNAPGREELLTSTDYALVALTVLLLSRNNGNRV